VTKIIDTKNGTLIANAIPELSNSLATTKRYIKHNHMCTRIMPTKILLAVFKF
jgi:hypothetical protein